MTHSQYGDTPKSDRPEAEGSGRWLARRVAVLGAVAALGLALALAVPVWARHGGLGWHADGDFVEFMLKRKLRHIDATEAQRVQILAIAADTREAILALRGQDESPGEAFVAQLVDDPSDEAELELLRGAQLERVDAGSRILVGALAQVAAVLTPEQREQLAEMHRSRHERWHH